MTDHDDSLTENELLTPPSQAMPGGGLSRLWAICSRLLHEHEGDELNREFDALAHMIFIFRTSPHRRVLRLRAARRVYADDDRYRDGEGRGLTDVDESIVTDGGVRSSVPAFTEAANGARTAAEQQKRTEDGAGAATAELKNEAIRAPSRAGGTASSEIAPLREGDRGTKTTPRHSGQGAPKLHV